MQHRISAQEGLSIARNAEWLRKLGVNQPVIYDIGAHRGEVGLTYAQLLPAARVWAFEPNPDLFAQLPSHMNVTALPYAVGGSDRRADFWTFSDDTVGSLNEVDSQLQNISTNYSEARRKSVQVRSVDSLVREGLPPASVMKIDVEGHELEVLRGAQGVLDSEECLIVQVELRFAAAYVEQPAVHEVLSLLDTHGFKLYGFDQLVSTHRGNLYWGDATFLSKQTWDRLGFL